MRPRTLDGDLFKALNGVDGITLVSILLPTHTKGPEVRQDRIRLKNLIGDADGRLESVGWRRSEREGRLQAARALLADEEFWEHQSEGLAVYLDDHGVVTPVGVPAPVGPLVCIATVFHTRHLAAALDSPSVPVLALTKGGVRLYEVDRRKITPMDVDLPASMEDVNWFMDREAHLNQHADRSGSAGVHHGHDPNDRRSEDIDRFLRAVSSALPNGQDSLVVLGDDALVERFGRVAGRSVTHPPHSGLSDVDDTNVVHSRVVPLLDELQATAHRQNSDLARQRLGTGASTTAISEALAGAIMGRVSDLVLRPDTPPAWGRFDPAGPEVETHDEPRPGDVDLIDRLVAHAVGTGADLRFVDEPVEGHDFVAVLRF